jgi:hypothetical protein
MPKENQSISTLLDLVEAPSRPLRASSEKNWHKLTSEIDFPFPGEFYEYGKHYGVGEIESSGYGLLIASPFDAAYPEWIRRKSEWMRNIDDALEDRSTRFYPEKGGMVPFAENWSGELLFFSADSANVAICLGSDPRDLVEYPFGLIAFLIKLFSGVLKPEYFPNKIIKNGEPVFKKRAWLK